MRALLPFIVVGVTTGSLYGLAGVGLVLTYRTSGVFNFGHGAISAAAAYLFYTLHFEHGWPLPVVLPLVLVGFGVVAGFLMEQITRRLVGAPEVLLIVATVGVLLAINGGLFVQYGATARNFPQFLPVGTVKVSGVFITYAQIISIVIATIGAALLYGFLRTSRLGLSMRAVVDNPTLLSLSGGRPYRVRVASWVIGCAFAALSGVLLAPTLGLDATILTLLVVQAFGAAALGSFSNLPLTYVGGIGVGVCASLATKYLGAKPPWNGIPTSMPFLILVGVLLVIPVRRLPSSKTALRALVQHHQRIPMVAAIPAALAAAVAVLAIPWIVGPKLPVWISALTMLIMFGSLALLVWVSGQISLCQTAFAAVGATTLSHLTQDWHVPWALALLVAGLVAVPVGALVAIPALRLSGVYLALATFGFAILMQQVVYGSGLMFGRTPARRATRPHLWFIDGQNNRIYYFIVLAVAVATCFALVAVSRGRLGRLLRGMSETPTALSASGLSVNITRLIVFCIAAFFAGIAGALTITQVSAVTAISFHPIQSLLWLTVLALCGTRLIGSSMLASAALVLTPAYVRGFNADQQTLAFGALAVVASILVGHRARRAAGARASAPQDADVSVVGGAPAGAIHAGARV